MPHRTRIRRALRVVAVLILTFCWSVPLESQGGSVQLPTLVRPLDMLLDSVKPLVDHWRDQVLAGAPYIRLTAARELRRYADRIALEEDKVGAALRLDWDREPASRALVDSTLDSAQIARRALREAANDLMKGEDVDNLPERSWFPVRNSDQAACFFGGDDGIILPGVALAGDQEAGVLGADLYSDYMGGARLTLSSALSAAEDEKDERANALRFIEGGGTVALGLSYPIGFYASRPIPCGRNFETVEGSATRVRVLITPRFGADLPVAGTTVQSATLNLDLGGEIEARTHTVAGQFRFFGQVRAAYALGSADFYKALGLENESGFFYSQATGGVIVANAFRLSWSFPLAAPDPLRDNLKGFLNIGLTRPTSGNPEERP